MTRRHGILALLIGGSACLLNSGCLFDRRPAADDTPSGTRAAKETRAPQEEIVASPYGAHPPGPILNPDGPRHDNVAQTQYENPSVILNVQPSPPPEPPVVHAEPPAPQLNAPPAQEPDPALVSALRCLLNKNPAEALEQLKQYDKPTQELLLQLLPFIAGLNEGGLEHSDQEMSALLEKLNELTAAVRAHSPLTLKKVCFCKRINGFGYYEALSPNPEFEAGTDRFPGNRVTIYAEVRNFRSVPKGSVYETHLVKRVEIYPTQNPKGEPITIQKPDWAQPTRSRSPQQDLFLNITFNLPPLPDGQYTLRVVVEDHTAFDGEQIAPRITNKSIDFHVSRNAGLRAADEGAKRRAVE
jgi:hypothetical protein